MAGIIWTQFRPIRCQVTWFFWEIPFFFKVPFRHWGICIHVPSPALFSIIPWCRSATQNRQRFHYEYLWNPPYSSIGLDCLIWVFCWQMSLYLSWAPIFSDTFISWAQQLWSLSLLYLCLHPTTNLISTQHWFQQHKNFMIYWQNNLMLCLQKVSVLLSLSTKFFTMFLLSLVLLCLWMLVVLMLRKWSQLGKSLLPWKLSELLELSALFLTFILFQMLLILRQGWKGARYLPSWIWPRDTIKFYQGCTFQRPMDQILGDIPHCFVDDILISSPDIMSHLQHFCQVLA